METLNHMSRLVTANTKTIGMLGARAMVLGKFFDAALPQLTTLQRGEVIRSFRHGIEDAMSLMDDVALSAEYHSALLQITNSILAALGQESAARQ
ncbi:hypothetical protein [Paraburkholderia aspalathi]|uniref:Uncharacterized protein n=1 Tax=Paraburkholderia aspalathi TaxID=1324617 RepID=A0A1I7EPP9_9BURK|nr:hypothetical protein [Paraburkholderia aspalathi]SFU25908.1 hypothetical protein SAMN05192563_104343 [Paraburkholderia aspalathi]